MDEHSTTDGRPAITPAQGPVFARDLLDGRVILVTGGGTGLGYSMAEGLGQAGARLVLAARNGERLEAAAARLRAEGIDAIAVPADLRDPAQVQALVDQAVAGMGRIDGLINNAAGNFLCASEDLSPGGFDAVVKTVLHGTVYATLAVGRHMIGRKAPGSILSIVATYVDSGSAFVLPSACAKAGVLAMTRSLAVEWAVYGIRLNAIAPGPFPTEGAWQALVPPGLSGFEEQGKLRVPMGRFGEHRELANLAVFLMSDACPYQNGDCVTVDGAEHLGGAGEFNAFCRPPRDQVKAIFRAMRPAKPAR